MGGNGDGVNARDGVQRARQRMQHQTLEQLQHGKLGIVDVEVVVYTASFAATNRAEAILSLSSSLFAYASRRLARRVEPLRRVFLQIKEELLGDFIDQRQELAQRRFESDVRMRHHTQSIRHATFEILVGMIQIIFSEREVA